MKGCYWTAAQRRALERQLRQTKDAAEFRRVLALLEIDRGRSLPDVARELRKHRSSLYRWIDRFATAGDGRALAHQPGQGRPARWNDELAEWLESTLAQAPVDIGYEANAWTVPLLQAFLAVDLPEAEISSTTLRRRLGESDYVWKRFRYVLPPDPQAEKKTAASGPNHGSSAPTCIPQSFGFTKCRINFGDPLSMEALFGFVIVMVLLAAGLSFLTGSLRRSGPRNQPLGIALSIARWIMLAMLVFTLLPLLLLLVFGIWVLSAKGRVWSTYWGHVLAKATTGLWHKVFGPPKVRVSQPWQHNPLKRRRRFSHWRN